MGVYNVMVVPPNGWLISWTIPSSPMDDWGYSYFRKPPNELSKDPISPCAGLKGTNFSMSHFGVLAPK